MTTSTTTPTTGSLSAPRGVSRNRFERLFLSKMFWAVFLSLGFSYPIYRSVTRQLPPPLPVFSTLPQYELINEEGQPFGSQALQGKPYIAGFFFTNCPSSCPALMAKMQKLQKRVRGLGTKRRRGIKWCAIGDWSGRTRRQSDSTQHLLFRQNDRIAYVFL